MTTCKDCAAPITQHAGRGRQWLRCEACRVQYQHDYNREYNREYRDARTPEQIEAQAQYQREAHLQKNYGIGIAKFDAMLAAQGGTCAVATCTRTGTNDGRALHVDHDHSCCPGERSCGKCVRWLLCYQHNTGLGMFNDDPAELRAAADLLESHERRA